jgi:hypothetical protein
LLPEALDDFVTKDNLVRIINVFVNHIDLLNLGFETANPKFTGLGYAPAKIIKLYINAT